MKIVLLYISQILLDIIYHKFLNILGKKVMVEHYKNYLIMAN